MVISDNNNKPIYLVIADRIIDEILSGKIHPEERLLSIRDYAAEVQVNHNTVKRTYDYLADQGLIFNLRGVGYYVDPEAIKKGKSLRTRQLLGNELDKIFRQLQLLGVTPEELTERYIEFIKTDKLK